MIKTENSFNHLLIEAIDKSFLSLGKNANTLIYSNLESFLKISKKQIPFRINDFSLFIESIFGTASKNLELLFLRNIQNHSQLTCKWPEYTEPLGKWLITPEKVNSYASIIWLDELLAEKIASETVEIIVKASKQDITFFNRKSVKSIIGGLFYLLGLKYGAFRAQREIADKLTISDVTVRETYKQWLTSFSDFFKDEIFQLN